MKSDGTPMQLIEVLLVEDNPGDVRLTKEAMRDAKMAISLHVVRDGAEAIAFLRQAGEHASSSSGPDPTRFEPP
jgi:chemotaxis family two-component system response regulator Rcp1